MNNVGPSLKIFLALYFFLLAFPAFADQVTPSDRVKNFVSVKEDSSSDSNEVGKFKKGERAELVESVPRWHKVRLSDGQEGFVPKAWTQILAAGPAGPSAATATSFEIHFLDVGTGDSAIVDMGDKEIVIDGGDSISVLHDYARREKIIQGPIELVVVTHGDSDHWKGLVRLLNFDGKASSPHSLLEFWEPGYNRDCGPLKSYDTFISNVKSKSGVVFKRPLEKHHPPATLSNQITSSTLPSLPNVKFTLLHSSASPPASNNDCPYRINNASIVFMLEINGVKILFTGDANGKERNEQSPGTPGHIEKMLLDLEAQHPGVLKADIIKVPHHGSETASTQAFIDKVNPKFVIISSSTKHHLPRTTTVRRYDDGGRIVLRTDFRVEKDLDHIVCASIAAGEVDCNYKSVLDGN